MALDYYHYKLHEFNCPRCNWMGFGNEVEQGEMFDELFEIICPQCSKVLYEPICYPTLEEVLKYGSEEEKEKALIQQEKFRQWEGSVLKNVNQLPDIEGDKLIFYVNELFIEKQLEILCQNKIIWKEPLNYEYYDRFIKIGKILRKKYGDRMVDFVPPSNGHHIFGDKLDAPMLVSMFRESLTQSK